MFAIICAVGLAGCLLAVLLLVVSYAKDKSMVPPLLLFVLFLLLAGGGIVLEWKGVTLTLPFGGEDEVQSTPQKPADTPDVPDTPEDEDIPEDEDAPQADPVKDVYGLGETAVLDGVQVTLTDVYESEGRDFLTPSEGCVYIFCEFEIANGSGEDIAVSSVMSFDAYIDDYAAALNISAMSSTDQAQLDGDVASGKKMRGVVGYEGESDWSEIEVRFAPNFWNGESLIFVYSK